MKRKKSVPYEDDLIDLLRKDTRRAAEYLSAALEDGDPAVFFLALRDVTKALGGMTRISQKTGLSREGLYKSLSAEGNPEFKNINSLLDTLGFKVEIKAKKKKPTRTRKSKTTAV